MKNNIFIKITMVILLISILLSSVSSVTVIADSSTTLEESKQAPLNITVNNNGVDETDIYKATNTINVNAGTRGTLGNIYYYGGADNCTYYYSADICITNDTSTYGSIRMVLGYCQYENNKKYIEVCVRPSLSGQTVFFLTGNGETAVKVGNSQNNIKVGDTYHAVAKYDCGKVSFWVNNILIFDEIALPETATDINLEAGFYSQNCTGTISNIDLWGEMETCECPEIGDNENSIYNVVIKDNATGVYKTANDGYLTYSGLSTNRTDFYGIGYGIEYSLHTKARFYDNKTVNGTNEVNWEGLIFNLATASKNSKTLNIELRIRKNIVVVFDIEKQGSFAENVVYIKGGKTIEYGKNYDYTVKYYNDGTFSLWIDGEIYLTHFDLAEYGYTDIKPLVSLGGEVCSYSFEDIELWGDISVDGSEYSDKTQLNSIDYSVDYDLSFPQKPQNNKNYMADSQVYSFTDSNGVINTNIYLNYLSLRKIKRIGGNDLGSLKFALDNVGIATDFNPEEDVTYSFDYVSDNASKGSITLYARYFCETKNTLNILLNRDNITVNNSSVKESFNYPVGTEFNGKHTLTVKMNGSYAVVFIDGVVCAETQYNSLSIPMLTFVTDDVTLDTKNAKVYRNIAGTDTVYTEPRYETGDINSDDNIDIKDLVRYKKVLAKTVSTYDKSVSDINGDTILNSLDIVLFKKALLNGKLGLGGEIEVFHDQSDFYMSDIQPDYYEDIELTLRAKYGSVTNAVIEISNDGKTWISYSMRYDSTDSTGDYQYFKGTVPGQKSAFYYRFKAINSFNGSLKTLAGVNTTSVGGWYCMVGQKTPDWAKGTLWYSIMPDTFFNGDLTNDKLNSGNNTVNSWNNVHTGLSDRYGGDFKGIEEKLGYIKSLGVESVYMNPISKAFQNAGYGTVDYNQIEPGFGNADSLNSLVSAIHNNDMRVMTDVVLYFSPVNSIYVNKNATNPLAGAMQSKESPYTQMLKFTDWPNYESTEWGGLFTDLFNSSLQNLLYKTSDSALQRLVNDHKVDGLRFDCGGYLGSKTDVALRNSLIQDIRQNLKAANPDMLMLSEYDYANMTGYSWDSQWNLDLRSAFEVFVTGQLMSGQTYNTTVSSLRNVMLRSLYKLPRQQALTIQNMMSFHDADRLNTDSPEGRASTLVQMTYLGSPVIYYGQEIGLDREPQNGVSQNGHAATSFYSMDWNEENWNKDMLSFYKTLGELRKNYTAVKTGALEEIVCDDELNLLGFARYDKNSAVITLANAGEEISEYSIQVSGFGIKDGSVVTDCFTGENYVVVRGKVTVSIPSGGTLLATGITHNSVLNEKADSISGTGYVTADVQGDGVYSLSLIDNSTEPAPIYRAVVNGQKVYVNVNRKSGSEMVKQTEFMLPFGAQLRLNRTINNLYYCSYVLDGEETVINDSAVEIVMDRLIEVKAQCLSGCAVPLKINVTQTDETVLCDRFDTIIPNTDWNGMKNDNTEIIGGKLIFTDEASVYRKVPNDDWTAETYLLSGKGALSVVKDSGNYLELRYCDSLQFVRVTNKTEEILAEKNINSDNGVYLQILRLGTDYSAFYSLDGESWNTLGKPVFYNPSTVTVSLSAKGEKAEFDYFMFGDGTNECKPHVFGGEDFAYTENRTEPAYSVASGEFEYTQEGIKSTTNDISLMSINNISYTDFYAQVTLTAEGGSTKAGLAFGMQNVSALDGYTLYRNAHTLILKYGSQTLKRAQLNDDRLIVWVKDGVLSVYNGNNSKYLYSINLTDYNGGYVGFFSENDEAVFKNYYVGNISDNWIAVSGDVGGNKTYVSVTGRNDVYGTAAYRGYALTDGTFTATLSIDKVMDTDNSYSGGLMLGSSFGKSPDKNGVCIAICDGKAILKHKGEIIDSYNLNSNSIKLSVTIKSGNYTININDGAKVMSCAASDCAAGCMTLYSINSKATLKDCSFK